MLYLHKFYAEIYSYAYVTAHEDRNTILWLHEKFNSKYNYKHFHNWPYFYKVLNIQNLFKWSQKWQMLMNRRPITNYNSWLQKAFTTNSQRKYAHTTTPASRKLSRVLHVVMTLKMRKMIFYLNGKIEEDSGSSEVARKFSSQASRIFFWTRGSPKLTTSPPCIVCLRHDKIQRNLRKAISAAIGYQHETTRATRFIRDLPDID